ncbi:MAG: hypothetical protein C0406_10105 [Sideroxydans sp.]|nr:hypothetical protein [Sideroxydans sp.]
MITDLLYAFKKRADAFEEDSHQIFSRHEGSKSRVISLDQTRKRLVGLSLQQDELFQQALTCIEREIYRAAHVMAWAAFIDFLEQKMASDGLVKVKSKRPDWVKYASIEEIRENVTEHELIKVAYDVGLISKGEMKTLHGLLSTRNQCAHPTNYRPGLNESIGYVAQLLNQVEQLHGKLL